MCETQKKTGPSGDLLGAYGIRDKLLFLLGEGRGACSERVSGDRRGVAFVAAAGDAVGRD